MIYYVIFYVVKVKVLKQVVVPSLGLVAQIKYKETIKLPGEL